VPLDDKIQFFKQLADLLNSGVLLPDALLVVASQTQRVQFQTVIDTITQHVHAGNPLSHVLGQYPSIFDPIMVQMVKVGEESSKLGIVLAMLGDYLQMRSDFERGLRSALLVPAITFGFFFCITMLIFVLIVPQFASMFQSANQDIPKITKSMIYMSDFAQSQGMVYLLALLSLGLCIIRRLLKTEKGKRLQDVCIINVPIIGALMSQSSLGYFLHAVSMLLQGGMPLPQAIGVAKATVHNSFLADNITMIEHNIQAGSSLSQAMIHNMAQIFSAQVIAIVRVEEESGRLAPLLGRAASVYQAKVRRSLSLIVTMINPLLMIALGVLITFLIMAVYVPIFNLSNIA
jgi:type II secretory pathway component PulF